MLKQCSIDLENMSSGYGGGGRAAAAASVPSCGVCGGGFGDFPAGAASVLGSVGGSVEPSALALALAVVAAAATAAMTVMTAAAVLEVIKDSAAMVPTQWLPTAQKRCYRDLRKRVELLYRIEWRAMESQRRDDKRRRYITNISTIV